MTRIKPREITYKYNDRLSNTIAVLSALRCVAVLTVVMTLCATTVSGYDDLRKKGCRSEQLALKNIAAKNVEWMQQIEYKLNCDPGFDFPLNFNPEASSSNLKCKADNVWYPDFLPDCNKEIILTSGSKATCPEGTAKVTKIKSEKAVVACRGCPSGFFYHSGKSKCQACAFGWYQDKPMTARCHVCPSLANLTDNKEVMTRVKKVSRDRLYHVLGCPLVRRLENGTTIVEDSGFETIVNRLTSREKAGATGFYDASGGMRMRMERLSVVLHVITMLVTICYLRPV